MSITAITLTGDRHQAFNFCQKWIMNQTVRPDQWIVVDDGRIPVIPILDCDYIRRNPLPTDPKHTMVLNLGCALREAKGDYIIIMEDDEYYSSRYIEIMRALLDRYEVAGLGRSKYYHLPTGKYERDTNQDNASFAQTAFRKSFLPDVFQLLEGDQYIDMRIWKRVGNVSTLKWGLPESQWQERIINGRGIMFDDGEDDCLYVGMKAMPGRAGICWGHDKGERYPCQDTPNRDVLRRWITNYKDFEMYMRVLKHLT